MLFYENQLFHIYNQGNNQRPLFFTDDNYQFFLWKMRAYLLPFGDLVAWCLMPNHFHWLFYVRQRSLSRENLWKIVDEIEFQRRKSKYGKNAKPVNKGNQRIANKNYLIDLNESIGNLQMAYTRALNKERKMSGSLFRQGCKAKDGWIHEFVTLKKNRKEDNRFLPGTEYAYRCLGYIHQNPVVAKIVSKDTDYRWSSAKDYAGLRQGTLCNLELGRQLMVHPI